MDDISCDIFCRVIDNYGDIGVSWRLARQLANEFNLAVRLWVDDLASFARLCPDVDVTLGKQYCRNVEVRLWGKEFSEVHPASLVIEAFACSLPKSYLIAMMPDTVWINLEYLSAESWVEGCHRLPSPHPPLTKYFFFPGFTQKTGGLILEKNLFARREAFLKDKGQAFWKSMGIEAPSASTLKVSLFCYENAALEALFDAMAHGEQRTLCLVPEGRILPQVVKYFDAGHYERGNLKVRVLSFWEQERYDELLWACDINFVRGEDSCVRAQWAQKPFVWQIYPQQDEVHWKKLKALEDLYCKGLEIGAANALRNLWDAWNGSGGSVVYAWREFLLTQTVLDRRAAVWARELSKNNLALNLLDFFQEIGKMRASKIEGQ
jgi:uncharacterized repeat protein (TIGR03837 family)